MSERLFKICELVHCSYGFSSTSFELEGYGLLVDMIDTDGVSYSEKKIITGCGDLNSKIDMIVKIIAISPDYSDIMDISEKISMIDPVVGKYNPHSVTKVNIKYYEDKIKRTIEKINFIKKYSVTRDEKLEIILNQ